jgi:pimeloyl-ACP methyl ester carboxylesterase
MEVIHDRAHLGSTGLPLILLPAAYTRAHDFASRGFIAAARAARPGGDIAAIETGMDTYLDGSIVRRLHETLGAVRPDGTRVWLAGISLGGLGALLYARAHPEAVAGIALLSPFIGTRGTVARVIAAGGFSAWRPPEGEAATQEHRLLQWLKDYRADDARWPDILLGYGEDDRFVTSYRLLAELLPAGRVVTATGGHDWETWTVLWDRLLRMACFRAG